MLSSLELTAEEQKIPFLSPTIPSIKPSSVAGDDQDELQQRMWPDTLSPTQSAEASDDSDDETFVDGLQSVPFLPGGINVPLPKQSAGLFTPTGDLLTFFPAKPKIPASLRNSRTADTLFEDPVRNTAGAVRIFPTFGNLLSDEAESELDFDSFSLSDGGKDVHWERGFLFNAWSFSGPWHGRQVRSDIAEAAQPKYVLSVRDVGFEHLPHPRNLAAEYRVSRTPGESSAQLCAHNASVANRASLESVAEMWSLMGLLLDDQVPLEVLSEDNDDILLAARNSNHLTANRSETPSLELYPPTGQRGKLSWANHPMGGAWLVRKLLQWAESRADIQLLALFSGVLAEGKLPTSGAPPESPVATLATFSEHGASDGKADRRRSSARPIPMLRSDSTATSVAVSDSPIKPPSSSAVAPPDTPFVPSVFGTPPLPFSTGGKLSLSGSVSPEHPRASFSAAARYYASSITDRLSFSGESPPFRRTDSMPSSHLELSTSFPSSWAKSISFASSAGTTRTGYYLSKSYESDASGPASDKTVDESSIPPTPHTRPTGVTVTLKNRAHFSDDGLGPAPPTFIPPDLLPLCQSWCRHYAKQLRSWGLLLHAAEFDKLCDTPSLAGPAAPPAGLVVRPTALPRVCAVCDARVPALQWACLACRHVGHMRCVAAFAQALCVADAVDGADGVSDGADGVSAAAAEPFTCPTGCGCACADLPFVMAAWQQQQQQQLRPPTAQRPSFAASGEAVHGRVAMAFR